MPLQHSPTSLGSPADRTTRSRPNCPLRWQTVVHIDNPARIGVTTGQVKKRGSVLFVEVLFGTNDRTFIREEYLQAYEGARSSAEDKIRQRQFGRSDDLLRLLTFEKLKGGGLHDFLYSMEAGQIDFYEYQFKPVLKFINAPTERLLIADEVGLGKTIEAALIWLEMQARHDARRLLVVCPKMIASKWRRELRDKFSIAAEIGTVDHLLDALSDFHRQSESQRFAWICTYSGIRPFRNEMTEDEELEVRVDGSTGSYRLKRSDGSQAAYYDLSGQGSVSGHLGHVSDCGLDQAVERIEWNRRMARLRLKQCRLDQQYASGRRRCERKALAARFKGTRSDPGHQAALFVASARSNAPGRPFKRVWWAR